MVLLSLALPIYALKCWHLPKYNMKITDSHLGSILFIHSLLGPNIWFRDGTHKYCPANLTAIRSRLANGLSDSTTYHHISSHHRNTMFNQSFVSSNNSTSSTFFFCLWLFSQCSWWLVLTDDRLSSTSDHTNSFSLHFHLLLPSFFKLTAWLALLWTGLKRKRIPKCIKHWKKKKEKRIFFLWKSIYVCFSAWTVLKSINWWKNRMKRKKIHFFCQERGERVVLFPNFSIWPLYLMV